MNNNTFQETLFVAFYRLIERIGFSVVKRRRASRTYVTDPSDRFVQKAMACADTPSGFYDVRSAVSRDHFLLLERTERRNITIECVRFNPPFYYPDPPQAEFGGGDRYNTLRIFKRKHSKEQTAFILLNAWGVKRSTKSDHKLARLLASNFDVTTVVSTLPLHKERGPSEFESGELALNGNSGACLRSFRQAVEECICVARYLRTHCGYDKVGIGGISLGGMIADVAASLCKFDFLVAILSSGNLADIVWNSPRLAFIKEQFISSGLSYHELKRQWRVIDPASFIKNSKTSRMQLIVGLADGVIPRKVTRDYVTSLAGSSVRNLTLYTTAHSHYSGVFLVHHLNKIVGEFINHISRREVMRRRDEECVKTNGTVSPSMIS